MQWLQAIKEMKLPPLVAGSHSGPEAGLCAMEMVAFMERLEHTDKPECTCKVLRGLTIVVNDILGDDDRQKLLPVLPELVGTVVDSDVMQQRDNHIMRTASRTFDFHNRHDYERDRYRGCDSYSHERREFEHYMREGIQGALRVIVKVTPPWQVADVLIGMLRECIKIGTPAPKTQFKKPARVKELAEVTYLPTAKAKPQLAQMTFDPVPQVQMKHYASLSSFHVIDPKKAFMAIDCVA